MRYTHPLLLEHLASSYVLGTLQSGARRRFERLQADRADVRALVSQWETRLGQLAISVAPRTPSAQLWPRIAARTLHGAAQSALPARSAWPRSWLPAASGLVGLTAGALAASLLFSVAPTLFVSSTHIAMQSGERLPPSYVGLLTDDAGNGKVLVSSLRYGKTVAIKTIGAVAAPAQGRLVLWALPSEAAPFALGTVPTTGTSVTTLPQTSEMMFSKTSKLAITVETEAQPSHPHGAFLFSGNCAKLW